MDCPREFTLFFFSSLHRLTVKQQFTLYDLKPSVKLRAEAEAIWVFFSIFFLLSPGAEKFLQQIIDLNKQKANNSWTKTRTFLLYWKQILSQTK